MLENVFSDSFPYKLEQPIGEGGMGIVYRAYDPELQRRIAIKVLRKEALEGDTPALAEEARLRFLQEARAAATLAHPGITTIFRIGEDSGIPYIAMEWLAGRSLESILKERAPLPVEQVAQLGVDLAEALDAAHMAGIVHRDIKPANLMVLNDGRLKVTDFGIARMESSKNLVKTQAGVVMATPMFASPEQIRGEDADARSDIFSAGIVLYLCLTGRRPFEGKTLMELATAVLTADPIPPRQHNKQIPEELELAVLKALRKKPDQRFSRAKELADALRPFWGSYVPVRTLTGVPLPDTTAPFPGETTGTALPTLMLSTTPVIRDVDRNPRQMILTVLDKWPKKSLGRQPITPLLDRLLDTPLHAEPFSGAAFIGDARVLLLHDGWILGAIDLEGKMNPDEAAEFLPAGVDVRLAPLPAGMARGIVPLLASLLVERKAKHKDLDSSYTNVPALAKRLEDEKFDGIVTLRKGNALGYVLLDNGKTALSLFSEGWADAPLDHTWQTWVPNYPVSVTIEEKAWTPLAVSYRRALRNTIVTVHDGQEEALSQTKRTLTKKPGPSTKPHSFSIKSTGGTNVGAEDLSPEDLRERDFAQRMLRWIVDELPVVFAQRNKAEKWKYIASWIPLITQAALHHDLPRPGSATTDFFDLVTMDNDGKVLHLAHRLARATPASLNEFVERVKAAKLARDKRGDVGGSILFSPAFDEITSEAYRTATKKEETSGSWNLKAEVLTGYEGFVRMGARRGFHLLLVKETATGFEAILPG